VTVTVPATASAALPITSPAPSSAASGAPLSPGPLAGQTRVYTFAPADYHEARIRGTSTIEVLPSGAVEIVSTRASNADQYVEWIIDPAATLPAGSPVATIVTVVCGEGTGDWWEVYGPYGSEEFEFEVTPPQADGCWRFNERDRYTDFRVEVWLSGNATMTISSIEFRVTFA